MGFLNSIKLGDRSRKVARSQTMARVTVRDRHPASWAKPDGLRAAYDAASWSKPASYAAWKATAAQLQAHLDAKVLDWSKAAKITKAWVKKNAPNHKRLRHRDREIKLYLVTREHGVCADVEFTTEDLRRKFRASGTCEGLGRARAKDLMGWYETWDPTEDPVGDVPTMTFDFGTGAGLFGHGSEHQPRIIDSFDACERRGRRLMYDTVATILCDPDERLKLVNAARERTKATVQLRRAYTGEWGFAA